MAARDVTATKSLAYPVPARRRRVGVGTGIDVGRLARRGAAPGLIVLMALGAFALWTVVPVGVLWLASQTTATSTHLSAAPILVAAIGIPAGMALGAKALGRLDLLYVRTTGRKVSSAYVPSWRRSVSDAGSPPPPGVLDKIMVASFLAASLAFAGWFLLFAGSSLLP
jgi:hypothetical protein